MRKGTPNQFIHELINKIDELKSEEIESSAVIVDDKEDVIEADEIIDDVLEEIPEDLDSEEPDRLIPDEDNSYLDGLYSSVEDKLNDLVDGVSWSGDEDNIYMDVNFKDGNLFTFTIPRVDLIYDMDKMETDINYICTAVREVNDSDSLGDDVEDPIFDENYKEDVDTPAYL